MRFSFRFRGGKDKLSKVNRVLHKRIT